MKQKKMLMRYLIIGINVVLLVSSCNKDYSVKAKFVFINETSTDVIYQGNGERFSVLAGDTTVYSQNGLGGKDTDESNYVSPLHTYCYPCYVQVGSVYCDSLISTEPANIDNFSSKKLGERDYEFTFRYTEEYVSSLSECE